MNCKLRSLFERMKDIEDQFEVLRKLKKKPGASQRELAKDLGFILMGQIDMIRCQYDSQYLYILQKTN